MNKTFIFLFISIAVLSGCCGKPCNGCKPVLFPYAEYEYKAEPKKLSGAYVQKDEEIIDFNGAKLALPQGWSYEKAFAGKTIKFFKGKEPFFIVDFNKNRSFGNDAFENFYMVGCKKFSANNPGKTRTKKEFYSDLYLFTDDQLDGDPTLWQYYILWSKTKFLRDAIMLTHYTEENLEAFQRIYDPRTAGAKAGVVMKTEIFPQKIAPDYLIIAAGFRDDDFFAGFLQMLNALNPHE